VTRGRAHRDGTAPPQRRRGFTLIELLVALAIFALLSVLGYRAIAALTASESQLSAEAQRWQALDALFARLEADFRQAVPRPAREDGGRGAAWRGTLDARNNAVLRFTRAGPEFAVEPGSAGQRLGYRLTDDTVEVLYWPQVDNAPGATPVAYGLVRGVASFRLGYLGADGAWRDRWPILGEPDVPRGVRVELTLAGGERIERWLALR
jgi:general secretion pathway protein J